MFSPIITAQRTHLKNGSVRATTSVGCTVESPARVHDQAAARITSFSFATTKTVKDGLGPPAPRVSEFENHSMVLRATRVRGSVQVASAVKDHVRVSRVGSIKPTRKAV